MSGNVDEPEAIAKLTTEVMERFNFDEKTTKEVIAFFNVKFLERLEKWKANIIKRLDEKSKEKVK